MVSYNTHRIGFVFCWGKYPGKKRGLRNRKKERERERSIAWRPLCIQQKKSEENFKLGGRYI